MARNSLAKILKNTPNVSKKANELLHNRFILYFVFIIAVANLFHFVFSHDLMSVGVFIVVGLLTSFFSKNMIVIMVISIVVTHVVRFGNGSEGFATKSKSKSEPKGIEEQFEEAIAAIDSLENLTSDDKEGFEEDTDDEDEEEDDEEEEYEEDEEDEEEEEDDEEEEEDDEDEVEGFRPFEGFNSKCGQCSRFKGKKKRRCIKKNCSCSTCSQLGKNKGFY